MLRANVVGNLIKPMLHFHTPKTSENQSFLIISRAIEMDDWFIMVYLILHTNAAGNPIKPVFHFYTATTSENQWFCNIFSSYREEKLTCKELIL